MAKPWLDDGDVRLYLGDVCDVLAALPAGSVQTCVTSPPYWGLRSYLDDAHADKHAEIGLERTPDEYVTRLVSVFREVRRVLRDDATLWLNLGDSYANDTKWGGSSGGKHVEALHGATGIGRGRTTTGLKPKDLVGIPWMVARALQAPQYMGRIPAERDRVWLAATLDAEGTICGFRHDRSDGDGIRTGVHTFITNSSERMLDEAARIWPASRSEHMRPSEGHLGTLKVWRWIAHGAENKATLLSELYPYLIVKRTQAVLGYNLARLMVDAKRLGHSSQRDAVRDKRDLLVRLLGDANGQRAVDVPSWCDEPPSLLEPGWYLRSDIIWAKPNPMPESVTDRPTKSHEYLFLLTKRPRYFFDADAIREAQSDATLARYAYGFNKVGKGIQENGASHTKGQGADGGMIDTNPAGRNSRSVWEISTQPFPEAHFATFPEELARRCILAGSSEAGECAACGAPWQRQTERTPMSELCVLSDGPKRRGREDQGLQSVGTSGLSPSRVAGAPVAPDVTTTGWAASCACDAAARPQQVLDPFAGSGTTMLVARKHGRRSVGIDLSAEYLAIAARRLSQLSLLSEEARHA